MVPWAQAVPPGGGSTALLLFLAAALQRGKSRYFLFIFGTSCRDSEWQKSEVRAGCSPEGCLLQVTWNYSVLE